MAVFSVVVLTAPPPTQSSEAGGPYVKIDGREALLRSVELFLNRDNVKQIQLVVAADDLEEAKRKYGTHLACGREARRRRAEVVRPDRRRRQDDRRRGDARDRPRRRPPGRAVLGHRRADGVCRAERGGDARRAAAEPVGRGGRGRQPGRVPPARRTSCTC